MISNAVNLEKKKKKVILAESYSGTLCAQKHCVFLLLCQQEHSLFSGLAGEGNCSLP